MLRACSPYVRTQASVPQHIVNMLFMLIHYNTSEVLQFAAVPADKCMRILHIVMVVGRARL